MLPFIKKLAHSYFFPIQQLAFVGDPDYVGCVRGRFVGLELKARGEKPRPLQEFKLMRIQAAGGVAIVATPDNWKEVARFLQKLDQGEDVEWLS